MTRDTVGQCRTPATPLPPTLPPVSAVSLLQVIIGPPRAPHCPLKDCPSPSLPTETPTKTPTKKQQRADQGHKCCCCALLPTPTWKVNLSLAMPGWFSRSSMLRSLRMYSVTCSVVTPSPGQQQNNQVVGVASRSQESRGFRWRG